MTHRPGSLWERLKRAFRYDPLLLLEALRVGLPRTEWSALELFQAANTGIDYLPLHHWEQRGLIKKWSDGGGAPKGFWQLWRHLGQTTRRPPMVYLRLTEKGRMLAACSDLLQPAELRELLAIAGDLDMVDMIDAICGHLAARTLPDRIASLLAERAEL